MNLVLLGGGGHAKVCASVALRAGWNVIGVVAPTPVSIEGCPWLGTDGWLDDEAARAQCSFLVSVGQIAAKSIRPRLFQLLRDKALSIATLVAKSALLTVSARLGDGSAVMEGVVVGPAVSIGENCILNTGVIVEHDSQIGDHCHVSTGAVVNGNCYVGSGTMVGSGAVVIQGVSICGGAVIGAGAVVVADIVEPGTWVGVPARRIS
jgi:sugar O-acyltransferase (sialic acid O-acetyltransferase NeuD family)